MGRSPPDILSCCYPCRPGPRRATKRKWPRSLCSPEQTRPDCPPRNVRLRKKYSTRIREVKNIPRQRQLLIVLVLILQANYLPRSPRGGPAQRRVNSDPPRHVTLWCPVTGRRLPGVAAFCGSPERAPGNSPRREPWVDERPRVLFFVVGLSPGRGDRYPSIAPSGAPTETEEPFCGPFAHPRLTPWAIAYRAFGTLGPGASIRCPCHKNGHTRPKRA